MHPEALEQFRTAQLQWMRMTLSRPQAAHRDPQMPEAVAEWFRQREEKHRRETGDLLPQMFAGVRTLEELERLGAEEMLARRLRASDLGERVALAMETQGKALPEDWAEQHLPHERRTVLGSVVEDDSTVHVLYRLKALHGGVEEVPGRLEVVTVRRAPAGWRLQVSPHGEPFGGFATVVHVPTDAELREDTPPRR